MPVYLCQRPCSTKECTHIAFCLPAEKNPICSRCEISEYERVSPLGEDGKKALTKSKAVEELHEQDDLRRDGLRAFTAYQIATDARDRAALQAYSDDGLRVSAAYQITTAARSREALLAYSVDGLRASAAYQITTDARDRAALRAYSAGNSESISLMPPPASSSAI